MREDRHVLLLTGAPGVGKTTVVRKAAERLEERGLEVAGFYTEEIREGGARKGFRAVTFDGGEIVISHVDFPLSERVGKYGVDVEAVDELAETALSDECGADVYVVDEVGKMECLSEGFVAGMHRLLGAGVPLLATVAARGGGLIAEVKQRPDAELWEVTRENRDRLRERIVEWLVGSRVRAGGSSSE